MNVATPHRYHCIFCEQPIPGGTPAEHIILAALGGRKSSTKIVCGACNHAMGVEIDAPLTKDFDVIRCHLDVKKSRGARREPPTLKGFITSSGRKLDVKPGGRGVWSSPTGSVEIDGTTQGRQTLTFSANNMHQAVQISMHQLRRLGVKPDADIRNHLSVTELRHDTLYPGQINHQGFIGGTEQMRSLAKTAFEFLALHRRSMVHEALFDPVRQFIRRGKGPPTEIAFWDSVNRPVLPFTLDELGPAYHQVTIWSCGLGQPLVGAVTLFGHFHWTVALADSWHERWAITHAIDPLREINLGERNGQPLLLGPDWARRRFLDVEAVKGALGALRKLWSERQIDQVIHDEVTRAFRKAEGHIDKDGFMTEKGKRIVIHHTAEAMTYRRFQVSWTTVLDPQELLRRVEAEYPAFCAQFDK